MNNISPKCFGPPAWAFLHMVSFGYPDEIVNNKYYESYGLTGQQIKDNFYKFFESLIATIPCSFCREHYKKIFGDLDLYESLDSKSSLTHWVYNLHNLVNKQNGVFENPSYESIYEKYSKLLTDESLKQSGEEPIGSETGMCSSSCKGDSKTYCKVELVSSNDSSLDFKDFFYIFLLIICVGIIIYLSKDKITSARNFRKNHVNIKYS